MCQKIETMADLKQKIEDFFARTRIELTQTQIATMFKRSGVERVFAALDELVVEKKLVQKRSDPVSPYMYQLVTD